MHVRGEGDVEVAGLEGEQSRRLAFDDLEGDLVQIRAILLEVIRIARQADRVAALELGEFERSGADGARSHDLLRHMTGIHRRKRTREQHQQARLRLVQFEGCLKVAVGRHVRNARPPDPARVAAEIRHIGLADQHAPGALHILGRERLAIMPFHPLAQLEGQFRVGCIP